MYNVHLFIILWNYKDNSSLTYFIFYYFQRNPEEKKSTIHSSHLLDTEHGKYLEKDVIFVLLRHWWQKWFSSRFIYSYSRTLTESGGCLHDLNSDFIVLPSFTKRWKGSWRGDTAKKRFYQQACQLWAINNRINTDAFRCGGVRQVHGRHMEVLIIIIKHQFHFFRVLY